MPAAVGKDTWPSLTRGSPIEVRTSFATWSAGFEVAQVGRVGYWVRRVSDGRLLPVEFTADRVRPA